MNNIGNKLKELRERNGLTRKEAVDKLHSIGIDISDKTLYGYESGRNSANADMFLSLCKIYDCNDIMATFYDSVDDVLFTNEEWKIIEKYRDLDPYGQETVNYILDGEAQRTRQLQDRDTRIKELESFPATVVDFPNHHASLYIAYYQRMASAGSGEYLFSDVPTDLIEVPDTPTAQQADFVLGVNGHSMEPTYYDSEKVFVKKAEDISDGEIGIFTRGNECFIKEKGADRLISHNPDKASYPDIPQSDDIRLVGIVIGKVSE